MCGPSRRALGNGRRQRRLRLIYLGPSLRVCVDHGDCCMLRRWEDRQNGIPLAFCLLFLSTNVQSGFRWRDKRESFLVEDKVSYGRLRWTRFFLVTVRFMAVITRRLGSNRVDAGARRRSHGGNVGFPSSRGPGVVRRFFFERGRAPCLLPFSN